MYLKDIPINLNVKKKKSRQHCCRLFGFIYTFSFNKTLLFND